MRFVLLGALAVMFALAFVFAVPYVDAYPTRPYGSTGSFTLSGSTAYAPSVAKFGVSSSNYIGVDTSNTRIDGYIGGALLMRVADTVTILQANSGNDFIQINAAGGVVGANAGTSVFQAKSTSFTTFVATVAPTVKLSDSAAKPTCDSTIAGQLKYEVAANVGTVYACHQTGAGAYAWVALH